MGVEMQCMSEDDVAVEVLPSAFKEEMALIEEEQQWKEIVDKPPSKRLWSSWLLKLSYDEVTSQLCRFGQLSGVIDSHKEYNHFF